MNYNFYDRKLFSVDELKLELKLIWRGVILSKFELDIDSVVVMLLLD